MAWNRKCSNRCWYLYQKYPGPDLHDTGHQKLAPEKRSRFTAPVSGACGKHGFRLVYCCKAGLRNSFQSWHFLSRPQLFMNLWRDGYPVPSIFTDSTNNLCSNHCAMPASSSWWRTPSRELPYWRLDAKYPFPLPSSMPCGPQSSAAERPRLSLSARWILVDQEVSANQVVAAARRRWHGGGPPLELIEPGARTHPQIYYLLKL